MFGLRLVRLPLIRRERAASAKSKRNVSFQRIAKSLYLSVSWKGHSYCTIMFSRSSLLNKLTNPKIAQNIPTTKKKHNVTADSKAFIYCERCTVAIPLIENHQKTPIFFRNGNRRWRKNYGIPIISYNYHLKTITNGLIPVETSFTQIWNPNSLGELFDWMGISFVNCGII